MFLKLFFYHANRLSASANEASPAPDHFGLRILRFVFMRFLSQQTAACYWAINKKTSIELIWQNVSVNTDYSLANISFTSTSIRVFLLFYKSKINCLSEVTNKVMKNKLIKTRPCSFLSLARESLLPGDERDQCHVELIVTSQIFTRTKGCYRTVTIGQELSVSPSAYRINPAEKDLRNETTTMLYVFYS